MLGTLFAVRFEVAVRTASEYRTKHYTKHKCPHSTHTAQVIGYSIGALLPLWMAVQLVRHRKKLTNIERILAALALTMGGWHTSSLAVTLHGLFDLGPDT